MNEEIAYQQKKIADELWIVAMMGVEVADRVKPDNPKLLKKLTIMQDNLEEIRTRINGIALALAQQEPYEEMKIYD